MSATILMTTDTIGSVWRYALDLGAALERRGVRVVLATMGPLPSHEQRREAAAAGVELHESDFQPEWQDAAAEDLAEAGRWLMHMQALVRPTLVHLNGYVHAALAWQTPVVVAASSCVCTWWEAVRREPAPRAWDGYRQAVREGLAAADVVVSPTRATLDALESAHGVSVCGRVVAVGRDPAELASREKEPLVLAEGAMWDESRNLSVMDQAAAGLSWPVYVAGPDRCGGAAVGRYVKCLGSLPATRVAAWMSRAAIYASPARYEPLGVSVVEAALSGCALVLADIPSLRETWGDAAWYVDSDDPAALQRALRDLIENPPRRRRLAAKAHGRASRYTADAMAEGYLNIYREVLGPRAMARDVYPCER